MSSAAFDILTFAYEPPPTLYSISGCEQSGLGTFHCVAHEDVLTLTGVGFRWFWKRTGDTIIIGEVGYWLSPGAGSPPGLLVTNDTYATVPLDRS